MNLFTERNVDKHLLGVTVQRIAVSGVQSRLHHPVGARVLVVVGCACAASLRTEHAGEIRSWRRAGWARFRGPRLRRAAGGQQRYRRGGLARARVSAAHHRRAVCVAGRTIDGHEAVGAAHRRLDDGRVVLVECVLALRRGPDRCRGERMPRPRARQWWVASTRLAIYVGRSALSRGSRSRSVLSCWRCRRSCAASCTNRRGEPVTRPVWVEYKTARCILYSADRFLARGSPQPSADQPRTLGPARRPRRNRRERRSRDAPRSRRRAEHRIGELLDCGDYRYKGTRTRSSARVTTARSSHSTPTKSNESVGTVSTRSPQLNVRASARGIRTRSDRRVSAALHCARTV